MGLTSFKLYQELLKGKAHFSAKKMGFACEPGDINEFANRIRLVKSFRGLQLEGYSEETKAGYNAFLLNFLTHSALERFIEIIGLKKTDDLLPLLMQYEPQNIASPDSTSPNQSKKSIFIKAPLSM